MPDNISKNSNLRLHVAIVLVLGLIIISFPTHSTTGFGRISGDQIMYFVYLQTIFEDGDLQFGDDYRELGLDTIPERLEKLPTGYTGTNFPPGTAILWSPFYLAGKIFVTVVGVSDREEEINTLVTFVWVGSGFYAALALLLTFLILKEYFTPRMAMVGTLTSLLVTPFLHYATFDPLNSHAISAFAVALFLFVCIKTGPERSLRGWALLGLAAGIVIAVRWNAATVLIWLVVEQLPRFIKAVKERKSIAETLKGYGVFTAAFTLLQLPQIIIYWIIFGPFAGPLDYGANAVVWGRPEIINVLFSTRHGLFSWHPLILAAIIGLLLMLRSPRRKTAFTLLAIIVLSVYVNSITGDWWAGHSFGMRRFVNLTPVFAIGFASLASFFRKKWAVYSLLAVYLFFAIWNYSMAKNYQHIRIPHDPTPMQSNPLGAERSTYLNKFGYPLSWPFSYVRSALMDGVAPESADWIASNHLFYSHNHFDGKILAIYPSFQRGFSGPKRSVVEGVFRSLDNAGTVYLGRLFVNSGTTLLLDYKLVRKSMKRSEVAFIELTLNGHTLKPLVLYGKDFEKYRPVKQKIEHWKNGVNKLEIKLWVGKRSLLNKYRRGELVPGKHESLTPVNGAYELRIYKIEFLKDFIKKNLGLIKDRGLMPGKEEKP